MEEPTLVDIRGYSFDQFVSFLFSRDVPPIEEQSGKKWDPWYWHVEVMFDAARICDYYIRLFKQPASLLKQFSKAQLEEAFWGIQGANLDCSANYIVLDSDLPFPAKAECIGSMFDLFRGFFTKETLDTAGNMWWDSFCADWFATLGNHTHADDDPLMQNAMFQTLAKILDLDSEFCQKAALHGLGHLHHPDTEALIQHFLERNPSIPYELKAYAVDASKFEIL